jgi:tetratricopeptide (TPR) repeat protein
MAVSRAFDDLLSTARALSAAGDWAGVRRLFVEWAGAGEAMARTHPELATLRADAELRTGHPREAHQWLTAALKTIQRSGDRPALRKAMNQLGVAEVELGALEDAERSFARALELARVDGDDLLVARATNNMGAIANIRGRRDEALSLYQLAIPAYQRLGHVAGLAESFHNMAISYRHLGQLERSDELERRAMGYASECANEPLQALARLGRAEISLQSGDARLAEAGAQRAAAAFAAIPDPIREADALRLLAAARVSLGNHTAASQPVERAIALARTHASPLEEAEALRVRAAVWAAHGDSAAARADIEAAVRLFEGLGAVALSEEARKWGKERL